MDLSTVLTHHLDGLGPRGLRDPAGPTEVLAGLGRDLRSAVTSFCGLEIALVEQGCPVVLTVFDDPPPVPAGPLASLSIPLPAATSVVVGTLTVFARTPGAFVDLAADLSHAFQLPVLSSGRSGPKADDGPSAGAVSGAVVVDGAAPPESMVSRLSGLEDLARVNRAIGVLIDRGSDPDQAGAELRAAAVEHGTSVPGYAVSLLLGIASPGRCRAV